MALPKEITASSLNAFIQCQHWAQLKREDTTEEAKDEDVQLAANKGDEFEEKVALALGCDVTIPRGIDFEKRLELTREALSRGATLIHGAVFRSGDLRGDTDFLRRISAHPIGGRYQYEVIDAKRSIRLKPSFAIQLCHYSRLVGEAQGQMPTTAYIRSGDDKEHALELSRYEFYYQNQLELFRQFLKAPWKTQPYPIEFCGYCPFKTHCEEELINSDHISLVYGARRPQVEALLQLGFDTIKKLASPSLSTFTRVKGLTESGFLGLQQQAKAQSSGTVLIKYAAAFEDLPKPSPSDLFFDMESDPYFEKEGLEYLHGFLTHTPSPDHYVEFHGFDRSEERSAFEASLNFMCDHVSTHANSTIYHYGSYEPSRLRMLSKRHSLGFSDVERLIENHFFDLYSFLGRALFMPHSSLSLKAIEPTIGFTRKHAVRGAADSIVRFERFLETGDRNLFDEIVNYNHEDVLATARLLSWLDARRPVT
jgi:predicted RecB family nuclease